MGKCVFFSSFCFGMFIFALMKAPSLFILMMLSVLTFCLSCEKVELPEITNESGSSAEEEDDGVQWGDSTRRTASFAWGYYCGLDLNTGEMTDSSGIAGVMGEGTETNPYTVYGFLCGDISSRLSSGEEDVAGVWLMGYIVGYVDGKTMQRAVFGCGDVSSNIILGVSPFEVNYEHCVPVQLPASPKLIRNTLNLCDNPSMLGRRVYILGTASAYMSTVGLKSPREVKY